ncbi:hypothetical protein BH18ACI2_BH18ACI2_16410 [soil metagenome]
MLSTFNVANGEFSIGRDLKNDITINGFSVSRHHCLLKQEAGQFKLYDLYSYNKTFINDNLVTAQALKHAEQIKIGNSLFIFLSHEAADD